MRANRKVEKKNILREYCANFSSQCLYDYMLVSVSVSGVRGREGSGIAI